MNKAIRILATMDLFSLKFNADDMSASTPDEGEGGREGLPSSFTASLAGGKDGAMDG
ncbi:hypothetical protein Sjap_007274 [Stephania japonica]|uniref:Uncharacterized protein n=1 Tax=Stephania japonica TaxID=461633 RepID=A0AAP0JPI3_9MAGN